VDGYVRYLARRKLVGRVAGNRWRLATELRPIQVAPGDVGYKYEPFTYAWNELQDMLATSAATQQEHATAAAHESAEES
jgi:hypothetical protein